MKALVKSLYPQNYLNYIIALPSHSSFLFLDWSFFTAYPDPETKTQTDYAFNAPLSSSLPDSKWDLMLTGNYFPYGTYHNSESQTSTEVWVQFTQHSNFLSYLFPFCDPWPFSDGTAPLEDWTVFSTATFYIHPPSYLYINKACDFFFCLFPPSIIFSDIYWRNAFTWLPSTKLLWRTSLTICF